MQRNKQAFIFGGGSDLPPPQPLPNQDALIICADGGSRWARYWGWTPDLIIGDLDSISREDYDFFTKQGVAFTKFPVEKDKTDMELAVDYAMAGGAGRIVLIGGWGGARLSHSLGNIEVLYKIAQAGAQGDMWCSGALLATVSDAVVLTTDEKTGISLISLSEETTGVHSEGLYYPLHNLTLRRGSTLGISNYATANEVRITIQTGVLLVIVEQNWT